MNTTMLVGVIQGQQVVTVKGTGQQSGHSSGFGQLFSELLGQPLNGEDAAGLAEWLVGAESLAGLLVGFLQQPSAQLPEQLKEQAAALLQAMQSNPELAQQLTARGSNDQSIKKLLELVTQSQSTPWTAPQWKELLKTLEQEIARLKQAQSAVMTDQQSQRGTRISTNHAVMQPVDHTADLKLHRSGTQSDLLQRLQFRSAAFAPVSAVVSGINMEQIAVSQVQGQSAEAQAGMLPNLATILQDTDGTGMVNAPAVFVREGMAPQTSAASTPVVHMNRFTDEMSQVMLKSLNVDAARGFSEAKILLHPDHLGQVSIKISIQNGHIAASFLAETLHGKESIENQLAGLRNALIGQGLQVSKLEVTQHQPATSFHFQDGREHQQRQQGQSRQQHDSSKPYGEPADFAADLEQQSVMSRYFQGGYLNVTA